MRYQPWVIAPLVIGLLSACGGSGSKSETAVSSSSTSSAPVTTTSSSSLSTSSSSVPSSSSSSSAVVNQSYTMTGRVAAYGFSDNLKDTMGVQADGAATGNRIDNTGGTVLYAEGKVGKALQLNATYGIRLPDNLIKSNEYTVSLWLKPKTLSQFVTAFFGATAGNNWINFAPMSWNMNTMLWKGDGNTSWYDGDTGGQKIPVDTWTHAAFAVNKGALNIYLNGELAFTGAGFPDVFASGTGVFALGVNYWDTPFDGLVDELRIYNKALSAGEVKALDVDNIAAADLPQKAAALLDVGDVAKVTSNLVLATNGPLGAAVVWSSSNTAVIANDGTVTRPALGAADAQVTLTATMTLGGVVTTKTFKATVPAMTNSITYTAIALDKVRITDGPFQHAQDTNLHYILAMDPERLLAPYRREAGITTSSVSYPSWESEGLDGHIGGHYLSALALMYASTGNEQVLTRLNYMIDALDAVQKKHGDGYIGGIPGGKAKWAQVMAGNITVDSFTLNTMWVPWYNLHKLYAGLRDAYNYTGNEKAKTLLIGLSDWAIKATANLTDAQMQNMLKAEHGGLNEVFADVTALTGDTKYITAAKRFSDTSVLTPLLSSKDQLTGLHANTQIPKVIGYARIGKLASDKTWINAADYFWHQVVNKRSVSIGGNSVREHFHSLTDFSSMISSEQGPESCNTYNMLKLTKALYQNNGSLEYIDYYERALYNHILSTQHPDHGGLVYFTPMRPDHYRVYSANDQSMWCCVGSGIESHAKYGEMIYAETQNSFVVNLYVPSTVTWKDGISFAQSTLFPDSETTKITLSGSGTFAVSLRYPSWVAAGAASVKINGEKQTISAQPGQYITLERKWNSGDSIELTLPMATHLEQLPDGTNYYSIVHGPIVLAAKDDPFPNETLSFVGGSARSDHIASGQLCPLNVAPVFISPGTDFVSKIKAVEGQPLTFTTGDAELNKKTSVTLIPFFRLHDSRYSVYFRQETASNWAKIEAELKAQAEAEAALAAITLDQVQPGEQQPESDHFIDSLNSNTGSYLGRFWRDATGWFSYKLATKGKTKLKLRLTFFGNDSGRTFDVLINDQKLTTVTLTGGKGEVFFDADYVIPDALLADASTTITVKLAAQTNSVAGGLFYMRLLDNSAP